jgi:cytosine/adenosine deaminase-related metal-dependent hydrolase
VASDTQLLIRGVTVVDPRDGSLQADQDVHVAGEKIVSVEPTAGDGQGVPARVVEAAGQYLVPGFNDMHAHPLGAGDPSGRLDLMLAHGVTGFRQMSGSDRLLTDRAAGTLMPAGAPGLLAMPGTVLTPFNAGSAAAAAATVRAQRDLGADFIKAPWSRARSSTPRSRSVAASASRSSVTCRTVSTWPGRQARAFVPSSPWGQESACWPAVNPSRRRCGTRWRHSRPRGCPLCPRS